MQIVSLGSNLHEVSNSYFLEEKKKRRNKTEYLKKKSNAEFLPSMLSVKLTYFLYQ